MDKLHYTDKELIEKLEVENKVLNKSISKLMEFQENEYKELSHFVLGFCKEYQEVCSGDSSVGIPTCKYWNDEKGSCELKLFCGLD